MNDLTEEIKAKGFEFELDSSWANGVEGRISYTYQKTEDEEGLTLSNSPEHLVKLNVSVPVVRDKVFAGLEAQYTSSRKTLSGDKIGDYLVANLTVFSQKVVKGLSASAGVYNLFDKKYMTRDLPEHLQNAIEQDGRTFRANDASVMLRLSAWAQSILTFQPGAADYVRGLDWPYQAHLLLGLTICLLFPFTRLVHMLSAPIWFLGRRGWQLVRTRAKVAGPAFELRLVEAAAQGREVDAHRPIVWKSRSRAHGMSP